MYCNAVCTPKSELWAFIVEIVTHLLDVQLELELLLHPGDALHSVPDLLHGRGMRVTELRGVIRVQSHTNKLTFELSVSNSETNRCLLLK